MNRQEKKKRFSRALYYIGRVLLAALVALGAVTAIRFLQAPPWKYQALAGPVRQYLDAKYAEEMEIEEDFAYADGAFLMRAHPVKKPEINFAIMVSKDASWIRDRYLESFANWDAQQILEKVVTPYAPNFSCRAYVPSDANLEAALLDFYAANQRPLTWGDGLYLDKLDGVSIDLYGYDPEAEAERICTPIMSDIKNLDFITQDVYFYFYKNEGAKKAEKSYVYTYTDGDYHRQESIA